jgi:hypothetical protein
VLCQVTELEDKLMSNNKELHAAQDLNQALQHEFKVTVPPPTPPRIIM